MLPHRHFTLVRRLSTKPELLPLPRTYDARFVESRWYEWWISKGFFLPKTPSDDPKDNFTIILPPPNVTGSLHLGHALTIAIEDALVRYQRMRGRQVLWVPGLDHAGIATQVQVEKDLWTRKNLTRHQIGREAFVKAAQTWKEEKSQGILSQIRRLGACVDWDRLVFTLDEKIQHGVDEAFIRLYDEGKIYRQERLVNWCGYLSSTISDIEVDHKEVGGPMKLRIPGEKDLVEVGYLSHFAYPVADSKEGEEIVVATTRLETMLGDTAVAVHPNDSRYKNLHGRHVQHPFLDMTLPIIVDSSVSTVLGTGAVKITPAHDYKDFEISLKHGLPSRRVIDDSGRMISSHPEIHGQSRFAARKTIERLLIEKNCWRGRTPHATVLPLCSRSGDIIEPQLKKQWFLDCQEYAQKAMQAVEQGNLQIVPERFAKQWHQWLSENKDWCLSRQLWWGQKIPAYRAVLDGEEKWVCAHSEKDARRKFQKNFGFASDQLSIERDSDVLDTWFTSSALPFLSFGWPNENADFKSHYPLKLMETGHDILFFWVARMVFLSLALTGRLPFEKVLLHGIICDKNGKKMSKSTGNVIDPMQIICHLSASAQEAETSVGQKKGKVEVGSDALRFALCKYETQQHFINVDLKHIEDANKFCNKIWQAFHLCTGTWEKFPTKAGQNSPSVNPINEWILSCLLDLIRLSNDAMENLTLDVAANGLYHFMYNDFCDVYLECTKPILKDGSDLEACREISATMHKVFDVVLRLGSLFMPNLAEELYQRLPTTSAESVCVAPYPNLAEIPALQNPSLQRDMTVVLDIARSVKNIRLLYGLFKDRVPLFVVPPIDSPVGRLENLKDALTVTSRSECVTLLGRKSTASFESCAFDITKEGFELYVHLADRFDIVKERKNLQSRKEKTGEEMSEVAAEIENLERIRRFRDVQIKKEEFNGLQTKFSGLTCRLGELETRSNEKIEVASQ